MARPLREGNLNFCLELYKHLTVGEKNLFFSPCSISAVMSMVLLGSRENTAKELKDGLGFGDVRETSLHNEIGKVLAGIKAIRGNVTLNVANKLFPEVTFALKSDFKKKCRKLYQADIEGLDFLGNPDKSRLAINDWAQNATKDKIKNLLPSGSITALTRMVLANAVYFKGDWKDKFNTKSTRKSDFHVNPQKSVSVDMMFRSGKYNIAYDMDVNAQIVQLPYQGDDVSMIIVLPGDRFGLAELEKKVTTHWLLRMIHQFFNEKIELSLPRMKLEQQCDLVSTMKKMGIKDVFSENEANLKGISRGGELYVSNVVHKAFIEVNEEGSEAAAVTCTVMAPGCAMVQVQQVTCDHPFMFFLMHDATQTMLFCGRFVTPQ